jgi:hypothetical protein
MTKINKRNKRIREIIILAAIVVVSFILWDTPFLFPVKLFVVFLHEASHAVAAIITGGTVVKMDVGFDLGGKCELTGGNEFIIASSGYLGSVFWGSLLFYSAYSKKYGKIIITLISIVIVLIGVNLVHDSTVQILSVLFACALLFSMKYSPDLVNKYVMVVIGLISCLYVVYDIKEDLLSQSTGQSDATVIAGLTRIPEIFWGLLWFIISIAGVIILFNTAYKKSV